MKKFILILLFSFSQGLFALNIHDVSISPVSENAVDISVNTEAVELYYFQSWQYSILDNTITIEAFYVPGFGSTNEYLNNNFEIPIDINETAQFRLVVKIYYINLSDNLIQPALQDEFKSGFATPLNEIVYLSAPKVSKVELLVYPNPTTGKLYISGNIDNIIIFDKMGREITATRNFSGIIDLSALQDGIYFVAFFEQRAVINKRIILKK